MSYETYMVIQPGLILNPTKNSPLSILCPLGF